MQESFWWLQRSDRYIINLFPHLHSPIPNKAYGGHAGFPVPNSLYGLYGRKATLNEEASGTLLTRMEYKTRHSNLSVDSWLGLVFAQNRRLKFAKTRR